MHVNPVDWDGYSEPNPPPPPAPSSTDETTTQPSEGKEEVPLIGHWNERLTEFQKLIMVRIFKEEKVSLYSNVQLKTIACSFFRWCFQPLILSPVTLGLNLLRVHQ